MKDLLVVILDGKIIIEYKRNQRLPGLQRRFLDKMDNDMDDGINIDGNRIPNANKSQRLQYVSNHLVNAILDGHDNRIQPACAYLAKASPDLAQIKIDTKSSEHQFNLIFDE
ncbi:MAG: hypothetical protein ACC653_02015 [Gammaproteobacteria bacterium]